MATKVPEKKKILEPDDGWKNVKGMNEGPYSLDNFWTRNSPHGKLLLVFVALQMSMACLLLGFAKDAENLGENIYEVGTAYTIADVSNSDPENLRTHLNFTGEVIASSGTGVAVVMILLTLMGLHCIVRQGKTAYLIFAVSSAWGAVASFGFGSVGLSLGFFVLSDSSHFDDTCDILVVEEADPQAVRIQCHDDIDAVYAHVTHLVLAPTITMIVNGCIMVAVSVLSFFARLNAPQNLDVRRRQDTMIQMRRLHQEKRITERKKEQSKISQAFRLLDAFQMFDIDASGTIDSSELATVLATLGYKYSDEQTTEMLHQADVDGDGEIDYNEFIKMMMTSNMIDVDTVTDAVTRQ